jgi:hypothetical protein
MKPPVLLERIAQLETLTPRKGACGPNDELRGCTMELVSWVAGEPWSEKPLCACPVITVFVNTWNDCLFGDGARDRLLKPLVALMVGTRSTPAVEQRRVAMAVDWLFRVNATEWLRAAGLEAHAKTLEQFADYIASGEEVAQTVAAMADDVADTLRKARDSKGGRIDARGVAWDSGFDAACAVAEKFAPAGMVRVCFNLSRTTWYAANLAGQKRLQPTSRSLEDSAQDLLRRLIAVNEGETS